MAMGADMKALLATLLLLGACVQYVPQERDVLLHIRGLDKLQEQYRKYGGQKPRIGGFTLLKSEPCEVWVTPEGLKASVFLHELKHCDEGDYHHY